MKEIMLIKLGEIVLKGLNRKNFEDRLIKNIRQKILPMGNFELRNMQSTIYLIPADENVDFDELDKKIKTVFGISRYSRAAQCEKTLRDIQETAVKYLGEKFSQIKTFKVESKRSDKSFPLKSPEISASVGEYIIQILPLQWKFEILALMFMMMWHSAQGAFLLVQAGVRQF